MSPSLQGQFVIVLFIFFPLIIQMKNHALSVLICDHGCKISLLLSCFFVISTDCSNEESRPHLCFDMSPWLQDHFVIVVFVVISTDWSIKVSRPLCFDITPWLQDQFVIVVFVVISTDWSNEESHPLCFGMSPWSQVQFVIVVFFILSTDWSNEESRPGCFDMLPWLQGHFVVVSVILYINWSNDVIRPRNALFFGVVCL